MIFRGKCHAPGKRSVDHNVKMCCIPDTDRSESEFVQLLAKHGSWIYAYFITLVPSGIDADEVFQKTNRTLRKKFDQFKIGTNFRAWAFRVAYYSSLKFNLWQPFDVKC